mmetsp:Transcript_119546/g.230637  ORF Transcript_119546/g.230637 Transcript_119546/m.230637 type:complete len:225 (+) Transcript_119546:90-764(+)
MPDYERLIGADIEAEAEVSRGAKCVERCNLILLPLTLCLFLGLAVYSATLLECGSHSSDIPRCNPDGPLQKFICAIQGAETNAYTSDNKRRPCQNVCGLLGTLDEDKPAGVDAPGWLQTDSPKQKVSGNKVSLASTPCQAVMALDTANSTSGPSCSKVCADVFDSTFLAWPCWQYKFPKVCFKAYIVNLVAPWPKFTGQFLGVVYSSTAIGIAVLTSRCLRLQQ